MPKINGKTAAEAVQPLYSAATKKTPGKKFVQVWAENKLDDNFKEVKELKGVKGVDEVNLQEQGKQMLTSRRMLDS